MYCFENTCRAVSDITGRAEPAHCVSSDNCQEVTFLSEYPEGQLEPRSLIVILGGDSAQDSPCSEGYCTKVDPGSKNNGVTVTVTETAVGQTYIYTAVVIKESTRTLTVVAPGAVRTPVKAGTVKVQPKINSTTKSSSRSSARATATGKTTSAGEHRVVVATAFGGGVLAFAFYLLA